MACGSGDDPSGSGSGAIDRRGASQGGRNANGYAGTPCGWAGHRSTGRIHRSGPGGSGRSRDGTVQGKRPGSMKIPARSGPCPQLARQSLTDRRVIAAKAREPGRWNTLGARRTGIIRERGERVNRTLDPDRAGMSAVLVRNPQPSSCHRPSPPPSGREGRVTTSDSRNPSGTLLKRQYRHPRPAVACDGSV